MIRRIYLSGCSLGWAVTRSIIRDSEERGRKPQSGRAEEQERELDGMKQTVLEHVNVIDDT